TLRALWRKPTVLQPGLKPAWRCRTRLIRPSGCGSKRVGFAVEADRADEPPMVELVEGPQDERIEGGGRRFESDENVIAGSMDRGGSRNRWRASALGHERAQLIAAAQHSPAGDLRNPLDVVRHELHQRV